MRAAFSTLPLAVLALGTCGPAPASPPPPPTASAQPEPAVRGPLDALPPEAEVGLGRASLQDHLPMELAARDEADPVLALGVFQGVGWADAARATWSGGGHSLTATVVQADRSAGAARLLDYYRAQASRSPLAASACPAGTPVQECVLGAAGDRAVAAGRFGRDAFRLEGDPAAVARALPLLAARLPGP